MCKNKHFTVLLFTSLLFFIGCKTTSSLQKNHLNNDQLYYIEPDLQFDDLEEEGPYKYLFIRLYDPSYNNPFYIANLLKGGIESTQITDLNFSHSSINFSLADAFFALTAHNSEEIRQESCTDLSSNVYMGKCNPKRSIQSTYAIKVTEDEYTAFKKFLAKYTFYLPIKYAVTTNFKMTAFSIKRKFFTEEEKQQFGSVNYGNIEYLDDDDGTNKDFVCSSFVAYALINSIPSVAEWFKEHQIDYHYVNVTDLAMIPGVQRIFTSTWNNYIIAAQEFTIQYPEFTEYLNIEEDKNDN